MGILRGAKFNNTHQTYMPDAMPIFDHLKQSSSVTKIILGEISPCRPGLTRLKIQGVTGSLLSFSYRGKTAVQQIAVTCVDHEATRHIWNSLLAKFPTPKTYPKESRTKSETRSLTKGIPILQTQKLRTSGKKTYQDLIDNLRTRQSVFKIIEDLQKKSRNKRREIIIVKDENLFLSCRFIDYEWHRSFRIILKDSIQKDLLKSYIASVNLKG